MHKGRPTYDPDFHPADLLDRMRKGELNVMVFAAWGISKKSFYRWIKDYPEMAEAYEQGESSCEAWWLSQMMEKWQAGDDKGFKYCALIVNTKFGYRENQSPSVTNNTQINVSGNFNVLQEKTRDELIEFINDGLEDNNVVDVNFVKIEDQNGS
jgi:hypothetical protein